MRKTSPFSWTLFLLFLTFFPFAGEKLGLRSQLEAFFASFFASSQSFTSFEEMEQIYWQEFWKRRQEEKEFYQNIRSLSSPFWLLSAPILQFNGWIPGKTQLLLGAGKKQGVYPGAGVVWKKQVIGIVKEVSLYSCRVQLLFDPGFKLSVRCQRNGKVYLLKSKGHSLLLEHVPYDEDLRVGDLLLTTGWQGRFPPGLLVGKIQSIQGQTYRITPYISVESFHPKVKNWLWILLKK